MALSLVNNVTSLAAQNSLNKTNTSLGKSLEKLSSGLKVNRGADGPAALVISEQQRAQISGLRAAIDNTNKAISVVQTGEGALNEISSLLTKARSLAVDSANTGVNDTNALAANQVELSNILQTIDRISNTTQFGSKKLLDGSAGVTGSSSVAADATVLKATSDTQVGTYDVVVTTAAEKADTEAGTKQTGALAADENLTINGVQIKLTKGQTQAQVIDTINQYTDQTGVKADNLAATVAGATRLVSTQYGSAAAISAVSDTAAAATSSGIGTAVLTDTGVDVAGTIGGAAPVTTGKGNVLTVTSGAPKGLSIAIAANTGANDYKSLTLTTGTVGITVANNALNFQIGANSGQNVSFSFDKVSSSALGVGASSFASLANITTANAGDALKTIDAAISDVSGLRGRLGAFQANTLESNANNLSTTLQNTTAAESTIRDTDFASEIANFTKYQTQLQAGTTVLGNANQLTQLIAGLLRG